MPLVPVAMAVFLLSALSYYRFQMMGAAADGPIQAVVLGIYLFLGYVPAIMLSLMVLIWSSIWFVRGSIERPWSRVFRIVGFTLSLALVVNVSASGAEVSEVNGLLGRWMAVPLDQAFGGAVSTLIAAAAALASLMLATDFLFYRQFDTLARGSTTNAAKSAAVGFDAQGVENLAVDELRELDLADLAFADPGATASVTSAGPRGAVTTRGRNGAIEDPEDEIDIALAAADLAIGDDENATKPGSGSVAPVIEDDLVAPRRALNLHAADLNLTPTAESVIEDELVSEDLEDDELEADEEIEDEDESEADEETEEDDESEDDDEADDEDEAEEDDEDELEDDDDELEDDESEDEEDESDEAEEVKTDKRGEVEVASEMVFPRGTLFPYRDSNEVADAPAPEDPGTEQLDGGPTPAAAAALPRELQSGGDGPELTEADLLGGYGTVSPATDAEPWVAAAAEDELVVDTDDTSAPSSEEERESPAAEADQGDDDVEVVHPSEVTFGYVDEPIFELPRPEAAAATEPDSAEDPEIEPDSPYQPELFSSTEFDGEVLRAAADLVVTNRRATARFLQRRLGIGFSDAVKLLDGLRKEGIVSGEIGSPKGSLLVDPEAWKAD